MEETEMNYRNLIIKIQALKASIDRQISEIEERDDIYFPKCQKEEYINIQQDFSNKLDHLLISEEDEMKKHFKY